MDAAPAPVDDARLAAGLERVGGDRRQRLAAETALRRRFAVVAGGPGTGKTTTVAHILALLFEQGDPLVALAAPTGKAAARLVEAVHDEARKLDIAEDVRERVLDSTPRRCTACSAGGPTRTAASATTAATGCRTTW